MQVLVIGAGVAGLCCALELAEAGVSVEIIDRAPELGPDSCSWFAGGMLAPWCEAVDAHPLVAELGQHALAWWQKRTNSFVRGGSLVLAQERDRGELARFAKRSRNRRSLDAQGIRELEADLDSSFSQALFFEEEAHIDPRAALRDLTIALHSLGVNIAYDTDCDDHGHRAELIVDCRGMGAREALPELRGVKGEMLLLHTPELQLARPIRLLHPRIPLYIVPRGQGLFMVGATMIESDDRKRISARSMIELLQAAYALHPAFAEAEVVEIGTEVRPAFPDNLPRITSRGKRIYVNGLYRHGFLFAPTLAQRTRELVTSGFHHTETLSEHPLQRSGNANRSEGPGQRFA